MPRRALVATLLTVGAGVSFSVALPASADAAPAPSAVHSPLARTHRSVQPAALAREAGRTFALASRGGSTATTPRQVLDPRTASLKPARSGVVAVSVSGEGRVVASRTRALGGRVLARAGSVSSVVVPKSRLAELADTSGVTAVRAPVKPHELATTSEGVAASQANDWQSSGTDGTGVTIGIVDAGFTGLAAAETAGELPAGTVVTNEDCLDDNGNTSIETSEHGTAVAEIAHEMAPGASLQLYCIGSNVGFAKASADIQAYNADAGNLTKIKIVSSSLGFSDDGRGDGTGASSGDGVSTAFAVLQARRSGVLWIESAGNNAENHWSGTLSDADKDNLVDVDGVYNQNLGQYENDVSYVAPATAAGPSFADIELQWDQWPATNAAVSLQAFGFQCSKAYDPNTGDCAAFPITLDRYGAPIHVAKPTATVVTHAAGTDPYAEIDMQNKVPYGQYWVVYVQLGGTSYPTTRYDLSYEGEVDGPSYLACTLFSDNRCTAVSPRSSHGSVTAPASSPYALAVGAADVGVDGVPAGTLEPFSSQGPTIDGRTKPEITGWDGVTSPVYGAPSANGDGGFYGTSAAAPHVAGAAALVLSAHPGFDPADLQNFLEQRANSGSPVNAPVSTIGHGLLTLGAAPSPTTPVTETPGARYVPVTPTRILDTRSQFPPAGNKGTLTGGGAARTVTVPNLPNGVTAVAVNVVGTNVTGSVAVSAYPGGTAAPPTSTLNLSKLDPTAGVSATVRVTAAKSVAVKVSGASADIVIDELGYFTTATTTDGLYSPLSTPQRVFDSRTGDAPAKLVPGGHVTVHTGAQPGQNVAVVNLTATGEAGSGILSATASCSDSTSSLNYARYTRANLAFVQLDGNGDFCLAAVHSATDAVVDVVGFMGATGSEYHTLPAPQRIVDTRVGNGLYGNGRASTPIGAGQTAGFYGAGVGDVPRSADALLTGVIGTGATTSTILAAFPGSSATPGGTSTVNFSPGRTTANAAVIGLPGSPTFRIKNSNGTAQAVVDLVGYFSPPPGE